MGTLADRTAVATGTPAAHLAPELGPHRSARPRAARRSRRCARARGCASRRRRCAAPASSAGSAPARRGARDPRAPSDAQSARPPIRSTKSTRRSWSSRCPPSWRRRSVDAVDEVRARRAARTSKTNADDVDELLLTLVDDGLLQSDLAPPIVGPAPGEHLCARLDALGEADAARALEQANAALAAGDLARGAAALASLPGSGDEPGVHAVLVHRPRQRAHAGARRRRARRPRSRRCSCACRTRWRPRRPSASRSRRWPTRSTRPRSCYGGGAFDVAALGDRRLRRRAARRDGDDDGAVRPPERRC